MKTLLSFELYIKGMLIVTIFVSFQIITEDDDTDKFFSRSITIKKTKSPLEEQKEPILIVTSQMSVSIFNLYLLKFKKLL
jgi:hypothetical protein